MVVLSEKRSDLFVRRNLFRIYVPTFRYRSINLAQVPRSRPLVVFRYQQMKLDYTWNILKYLTTLGNMRRLAFN